LRHRESVIDEESERAVTRWVRLADQVVGRPSTVEERPSCGRCGTTYRVLDPGDQALCARCYLERGPLTSSLPRLAASLNELH